MWLAATAAPGRARIGGARGVSGFHSRKGRERETLSLSAGCAAARMSGRRVTPPSSLLEATCPRPEFHGI